MDLEKAVNELGCWKIITYGEQLAFFQRVVLTEIEDGNSQQLGRYECELKLCSEATVSRCRTIETVPGSEGAPDNWGEHQLEGVEGESGS
jgi:hypothetical protein